MMLLAFAVFDSKAEAYLRPFFAETKGLALRNFVDAVQDSNSPMGKHPEDYTLFHVGAYNQLTGVLESKAAFESLGNAVTFRELRVS